MYDLDDDEICCYSDSDWIFIKYTRLTITVLLLIDYYRLHFISQCVRYSIRISLNDDGGDDDDDDSLLIIIFAQSLVHCKWTKEEIP